MERRDIRDQVEHMLNGLTRDPSLRDDLRQEALIRLWQLQEESPPKTTTWYVQSCRFRALHYIARGRSVDSPKRCAHRVLPVPEDEESWIQHFGETSPVLQCVSARDLLASLSRLLNRTQMQVLEWTAEGMSTREIAGRLHISHPMVIKHLRKIAAAAETLSLDRHAFGA